MAVPKKKLMKIVKPVYKVIFDGKSMIYLKKYNRDGSFIYSELLIINGRSCVKVCDGGLNLYCITKKQYRRFFNVLNKGCSIHLIGTLKNDYRKKYQL